MNAFSSVVLHERHVSQQAGSHGITIYGPASQEPEDRLRLLPDPGPVGAHEVGRLPGRVRAVAFAPPLRFGACRRAIRSSCLLAARPGARIRSRAGQPRADMAATRHGQVHDAVVVELRAGRLEAVRRVPVPSPSGRRAGPRGRRSRRGRRAPVGRRSLDRGRAWPPRRGRSAPSRRRRARARSRRARRRRGAGGGGWWVRGRGRRGRGTATPAPRRTPAAAAATRRTPSWRRGRRRPARRLDTHDKNLTVSRNAVRASGRKGSTG